MSAGCLLALPHTFANPREGLFGEISIFSIRTPSDRRRPWRVIWPGNTKYLSF